MAENKAEAVVSRLQSAGVLPPVGDLYDAQGNINKDAAGQAALKFTIATILAVDPETGQAACTIEDRLGAARTFLAYTLPPARCVSRREAKIGQAEHVLSLILASV